MCWCLCGSSPRLSGAKVWRWGDWVRCPRWPTGGEMSWRGLWVRAGMRAKRVRHSPQVQNLRGHPKAQNHKKEYPTAWLENQR